MRTIYLVKKTARYGGAHTLLRAFETRQDAEDLIEVLQKADVDGLMIDEIILAPPASYSRNPVPKSFAMPRFASGAVDATPSLAELP